MRWTMFFVVTGCADRLPLRSAGAEQARVDGLGIVLNEILADPGTSGDANCDGNPSVTSDEFVELVNVSSIDVDLSGGTVSDAILVRHTFPPDTVLAPGGALLVYGGGAPERCPGAPASVVLQTASTGALGLSNDGDRVLVVAADGEILGDHTYDSEGNADQSLVRSPELSDGPFVQHTTVSDLPWSAGTAADRGPFGDAPTVPDEPADPLCGALGCDACEAAGFFAPTVGLEGDALVAVLHALTDDHDCSDYGGTTDFLFVGLDGADGDVECVYTGRITAVDGDKPDNEDMNTEHSWPQSLGAGSNPARCDLHHLYPSDSRTNSIRGNVPYGEVVTDTSTVDGGSRAGDDADGERVFEPRDAHKGNVARSMVYFAMRYDHDLSDGEIALYRAWSALDPVDETEVERTNVIAERQNVANPFVLCPWLVDQL